MRLSAAHVTVGPTKLGRTALGANLRGGRAGALHRRSADVWRHRQRLFRGSRARDAIAEVKAQFQFTDIDLQPCVSELFGINKLSGRGNLNVSLVASGASPFGLASSLDGTATLTGHDGAISGFNVEQLLKRLERRPLSGAGNFRSGATPYDNLTIAVKLSDGVATAEDVRIEGPASHITLTGTTSIPAREYDLKGVASLNATSRWRTRLRPAVRAAGTMGRSPGLSRSREPAQALARRRPAAPCRQGPQDPRRRTLDDRALHRRRRAGARCRRNSARQHARGDREIALKIPPSGWKPKAARRTRPIFRLINLNKQAAE